jgi:GT2 family glycosyltransferase
MKTSVIVINWNGADKLKKYLPEILKVRGVDEFIVADDHSTDNSIEVVKSFPEVKLVERQTNNGFSSNVNSGARRASGDLVFLLNPDAVPDKDCLEKALPYFKDPLVFSVSCNTGGNWSWAKFEKGFFWHYMKDGAAETHQTLWARGGSGIYRKDLLEKLNGMDELFNPYYEEDLDLGYRATKRGYKNIWIKECRVTLNDDKGVIELNVTKKKVSAIAQRNQLLFIWKNITSERLFLEHKKALAKMLLTKPSYWNIFLSALKKWDEVSKKRRVEKKESMLTDEEILTMFGNEN